MILKMTSRCLGLSVGHDRQSRDRHQTMSTEHAARRRRVRLLQKYLLNPPVKLGVHLGLIPGYALVETVGRRTGKRRRTVVGVHVEDDTAWIVAEQGRHAGYVANLRANPRVRLRLSRRWRTGEARIIPDDDPQQRLDRFGRSSHAAAVRRFGTDLLTVQVDLHR
jgi:deazaflavin-dependent oxidoreductase (nitroreductase family)